MKRKFLHKSSQLLDTALEATDKMNEARKAKLKESFAHFKGDIVKRISLKTEVSNEIAILEVTEDTLIFKFIDGDLKGILGRVFKYDVQNLGQNLVAFDLRNVSFQDEDVQFDEPKKIEE